MCMYTLLCSNGEGPYVSVNNTTAVIIPGQVGVVGTFYLFCHILRFRLVTSHCFHEVNYNDNSTH